MLQTSSADFTQVERYTGTEEYIILPAEGQVVISIQI